MAMYGDSSKFKQILYNLLSNAIKFTPEKGVVTVITREVATGVGFDGGAGAKPFVTACKSLVLGVRDTGIGIHENEQEKIFQEFEQAEQTRARGYEGTGLGLALTRKLVQLHGGHLWVRSEINQGSEFSLVIPIKGQNPDEECGEEAEDA